MGPQNSVMLASICVRTAYSCERVSRSKFPPDVGLFSNRANAAPATRVGRTIAGNHPRCEQLYAYWCLKWPYLQRKMSDRPHLGGHYQCGVLRLKNPRHSGK